MSLQEKVNNMCVRQLEEWDLAAHNYKAIDEVLTRIVAIHDFNICVQFNPARIVSSAAKVDKHTIENRRCFLCPAHLPKEQLRLTFLDKYYILCNPYPIFKRHLTIPSIEHTEQFLLGRIGDMLDLSEQLPDFTIFYNGPRCGASAPDHAHFQASPFGDMPMDLDVDKMLALYPEYLLEVERGVVYRLTHYLRNGFIIRSNDKEVAIELFLKVCSLLPVPEGDKEPMMNVFVHYQNSAWQIILIPRKRHRPWQYFAEEPDKLISSPGAADIGGLFITVRESDFKRTDRSLLLDIYEQICYSDDELKEMIEKNNHS